MEDKNIRKERFSVYMTIITLAGLFMMAIASIISIYTGNDFDNQTELILSCIMFCFFFIMFGIRLVGFIILDNK